MIVEPPSLPLITKSLSDTAVWITKSVDEFVTLPNSVPASLNITSAPSASSMISPEESKVISVPSFVIVSNAILPMLLIFASLKSNAPATVSVPDISTLLSN